MPGPFRVMLEQRRRWAEEDGLSPGIVEGLYRDLVRHFISEEKRHRQEPS